MRASRRGLLAGIAALALLTPVVARAQTPGWHVPILTGLTCPAGTYSLDLTGAPICFNGVTYPSIVQAPGWTYTRAGAATASDAAGNVIPFAANVPRITSAGMLSEAAATNISLWSDDYTQSAWSKANVTITAAFGIAPDGSSPAQRVQLAATAQPNAAISETLSASASNSHTGACYVRATSGTQKFAIRIGQFGGLNYLSSDLTATTTWQRYTFTATFVAGSGVAIFGPIGDAAGEAADLEVWGCDFRVNQSFMDSHIPTTSATATRGADNAEITGLSIKSPTTLVASAGNVPALGALQIIGYAVDASVLGIGSFRNIGSTSMIGEVVTSGPTVGDAANTIGGGTKAILKQAVEFDGTNVSAATNGGATANTARAGSFTATRLFIGQFTSNNDYLGGYVRSIKIISNANGNLQALSSGQ